MHIKRTCFGLFLALGSLKAASQLSFPKKADSLRTASLTKLLPSNFYNQHKGFFCKKEDQLQKRTGLPLFIRLGNKEYVDKMEKRR
ncbi:hypothetical protein V9K67_09565 [Paraflavisolibacter sp. H34]|uniref:hypothetical protein n=1 Tax=Huijunlia imazamoxiresistens TaxID=3127457 RepID=UPI00301A0FA8